MGFKKLENGLLENILTKIATYNVADIEPKYVTVKGSLSTLSRCFK